jgi:hypothetical protein
MAAAGDNVPMMHQAAAWPGYYPSFPAYAYPAYPPPYYPGYYYGPAYPQTSVSLGFVGSWGGHSHWH